MQKDGPPPPASEAIPPIVGQYRREEVAVVTSVPVAVDGTISLRLNIPDGATQNVLEHYKKCVAAFAKDLSWETSRLEMDQRAKTIDKPEITATMVDKANEAIRSPPAEKTPLSIPLLVAQLVSFAAAIMTPIFGAALHSRWQWTVAIGCGILALACQTYVVISIAVRRK